MAELWYFLVAGMLLTYVVLDGFDLGVGILHLLVARDDPERRLLLRAIGPVWDANEVWLIAAGGSLLMAFPTLLATAFSGFYLPLMLVLWLLLFRALGIELRHQLDHPLWQELWDAAFFASSFLLALVYGLAIGNVVRGVDMGPDGRFFAPLWTNLRVDPAPGVIDWYTLLCALTVVLVLTQHGALWLCWRATGRVRERAAGLLPRLWFVVVVSLAATTWATFAVQPQLAHNLASRAATWLPPVLACAGLIGLRLSARSGAHGRAFGGSVVFIGGMLLSAAAATYPYMLPAREAARGLTISAAAGEPEGLRTALYWWLPGMAIAIGYFVYTYRSLPRALSVDDAESH